MFTRQGREDAHDLSKLHGGSGGPQSVVLPVRDESDVGAARRASASIAHDAGMNEADAGTVALIVTEAATNIARYGKSGSIIISDLRHRGRQLLEVIAVDSGDGIQDMSRALADGFSTGGTPGKGLGAIRRTAAEFDLWSAPSKGTALVARVALRNGVNDIDHFSSGAVCTPIKTETACGDAWLIETYANTVMIALADGLGHGEDAAQAADYALEVIRQKLSFPLAEILDYTHRALRATRGAALQIVRIDTRGQTIMSVGVGNIASSISTHAQSKSLPSQPGIVGHQMPRVREQSIPWPQDSLLVMHSDGISSRWSLDTYPGLRVRDAALSAAILHRDFARGRDDATVVTYRAA